MALPPYTCKAEREHCESAKHVLLKEITLLDYEIRPFDLKLQSNPHHSSYISHVDVIHGARFGTICFNIIDGVSGASQLVLIQGNVLRKHLF